ncbi:unnamed protein product [Chrysodeixis includens]|uniref:Uncharacterized protein n=1 Tax=Chrysodeixis includens TaxID=689277 RepID=A0A9N8Q0D0_CHRIL|nr:unnamed protein product [Chrysodeixis includens]
MNEDAISKSGLLENEMEASEEFVPILGTGDNIKNYNNGELDLLIEEELAPLDEDTLDAQNTIKTEDEDYLSSDKYGDRYVDNVLGDRIKDEIMETAAGFAPVPLVFRKRQRMPPRRRFTIRRQYQRYPFSPYRRYHSVYPYYSYYRPSSLRFYRY